MGWYARVNQAATASTRLECRIFCGCTGKQIGLKCRKAVCSKAVAVAAEGLYREGKAVKGEGPTLLGDGFVLGGSGAIGCALGLLECAGARSS